jgi:hypothetical protein
VAISGSEDLRIPLPRTPVHKGRMPHKEEVSG